MLKKIINKIQEWLSFVIQHKLHKQFYADIHNTKNHKPKYFLQQYINQK